MMKTVNMLAYYISLNEISEYARIEKISCSVYNSKKIHWDMLYKK